jgi:hypothetical protein
LKRQLSRFGAVLTLGLPFVLAPHADATPIQPGSSMSLVGIQQVAVNLQYIDLDYTGTTKTGSPPTVDTGTVDASGSGTYLITGGSGDFAPLASAPPPGNTLTAASLCQAGDAFNGNGPCAASHMAPAGVPINILFMTLANGWTITMTELLPGDFTPVGCLGAPGSGTAGQTCTPINPDGSISPFDLTNNGPVAGGPVTGVGIEMDFFGILTETTNGNQTAPVKGSFSTTFNSTDLQTVLFDISQGLTVVSSAQATVGIQSQVPEPSTFAFMVIGGLLIGCTLIPRKSKA